MVLLMSILKCLAATRVEALLTPLLRTRPRGRACTQDPSSAGKNIVSEEHIFAAQEVTRRIVQQMEQSLPVQPGVCLSQELPDLPPTPSSSLCLRRTLHGSTTSTNTFYFDFCLPFVSFCFLPFSVLCNLIYLLEARQDVQGKGN